MLIFSMNTKANFWQLGKTAAKLWEGTSWTSILYILYVVGKLSWRLLEEEINYIYSDEFQNIST